MSSTPRGGRCPSTCGFRTGTCIVRAASLGNVDELARVLVRVDQATWTPIPEARKAQTELSGLPSACTYSFRYRASTRAGQQDYSQVVSLLVH